MELQSDFRFEYQDSSLIEYYTPMGPFTLDPKNAEKGTHVAILDKQEEIIRDGYNIYTHTKLNYSSSSQRTCYIDEGTRIDKELLKNQIGSMLESVGDHEFWHIYKIIPTSTDL